MRPASQNSLRIVPPASTYEENDLSDCSNHENWHLIESCFPHSLYLRRIIDAKFFPVEDLLAKLDVPLDEAFFKDFAPWKDHLEELDSESLSRDLRILRHFVLCHILVRDLSGLSSLDEVMGTITKFADFAIKQAADFSHSYYSSMYGECVGAMSGKPVKLSVIAMGKMGGYELNVSSDIDLIFIYQEMGETTGRKQLSSQEYFTKVGKMIISLLNDSTAWNQVFRVDMRLRPDGDAGPLVLSETALEQYLVKHGRDWERYAWTKARVVTDYPNSIKSLVRPFVFRKYLDYNAYEGMRKLHAQIRQEVKRKNMGDNIKLGEGGIREVEFIAQIHQLIRGGQNRSLQLKGTQETYRELVKLGKMTKEEADTLLDSYRFLRDVEHRLQYRDDKQTQLLPTDPEERRLLAKSMGYDDYEPFLSVLNAKRAAVHKSFVSILANPDESSGSKDSTAQKSIDPIVPADGQPDAEAAEKAFIENLENERLEKIAKMIQVVSFDENAIDDYLPFMQELGFEDGGGILRQIHDLHHHSKFKHLSETAQIRLERILPQILNLCASQRKKDVAFTRTMVFIDAILRRSSYLALLHERPQSLVSLIFLLSQSAFVADYLTRHPMLLDDLLSASLLNIDWNWEEEENKLHEAVAPLRDDPEAQMDEFRHFQHSHVFKLAVQDLNDLWGVEHLSDQLSFLADLILRVSLDEVWPMLKKRHLEKPKFAVIGYGKLGGKELSYTSDLDLVYIFEDESQGAAEIYSRLANRFTTWLSAATGAGKLYDVDTRLRPNGEAGLTVVSFPSFKKYQLESAWTWEHQALTRARFIAGDEEIGEKFENLRVEILSQKRDPEKLRADIVEMRGRSVKHHDTAHENLKHARGGIFDVEFIVQYLVLLHSCDHPELMRNYGNIALLAMSADAGLIPKDISKKTCEAYRTYRKIQHNMKLRDEDDTPMDVIESHYEDVMELWHLVLGAHPDD